MTDSDELAKLSIYACRSQKRDIALMLMNTYAMSEQDSEGKITISAYTLQSMLEDAVWRGFCDGIEACKPKGT